VLDEQLTSLFGYSDVVVGAAKKGGFQFVEHPGWWVPAREKIKELYKPRAVSWVFVESIHHRFALSR